MNILLKESTKFTTNANEPAKNTPKLVKTQKYENLTFLLSFLKGIDGVKATHSWAKHMPIAFEDFDTCVILFT